MRSSLHVEVLDHLGEVSPAAWDALAGDDNPFVEHGFLRGLEVSGCVGPPSTGWVPRHLVVKRGDLCLGAMPLYEKHDSYGEYIFDWGWARAAHAAGIPYYPKLVSAVPFTPATGPRLLLHPQLKGDEEGRREVLEALIGRLQSLARDLRASSAHVLFLPEHQVSELALCHFMPRASYQFHWENHGGWSSFDAYLEQMRSRQRKQIRKERREAAAHGLTLSVKRGPELSERDWAALWEFYRITTSHKWGSAYLTREFFAYVRHHLVHRVVCAFAHQGEEPLAGTLMFYKGDQLFGRYWGAKVPLRNMHFELCYYLPIEWCIQNGIRRFEAGAQGEHKLKRGLLPNRCHSAHWIQHPGLAEAVAEFLPREELAVEYEMSVLDSHGPFRREE